MSELTPEELSEIFKISHDSSRTQVEDQTVNTLLQVFRSYGEYLFSSCQSIKPKCTLKKDIFFAEEVFIQLIKVLRKHKNRKALFSELMYFKKNNETLFENNLLHHEKVNAKEIKIDKYPNKLCETLYQTVLDNSIELNEFDKTRVVKDWTKYQGDVKLYREKIMSDSERLKVCSLLNGRFKRLLLSQLNREEFIRAWVGCDENVFRKLLSSLHGNTLKLYTEDYQYALNEYKNKKVEYSKYLKNSKKFIETVEDLFDIKEVIAQPEVFEDEIELKKLCLKKYQNEDEIDSQEKEFFKHFENKDFDETYVKKFQLDVGSGSDQSLCLILLSYLLVSFQIKNVHVVRELNHIYNLYKNDEDNTLLEFKSDREVYFLTLSFKNLKQLYKNLLKLHKIEK